MVHFVSVINNVDVFPFGWTQWLEPSYTTLHRRAPPLPSLPLSSLPPSFAASFPRSHSLSVGSRAIEPELKPYPFYTTKERTAITPRTNRRMALFNSKANKKFADRGWIRQETEGEGERQGSGEKREKLGIKKGREKIKYQGRSFPPAIYSVEHFPRVSWQSYVNIGSTTTSFSRGTLEMKSRMSLNIWLGPRK